MSQLVVNAVVTILCLASVAFAREQVETVQGVRYVVRKDQKLPFTVFNFTFDVGSANDPEGQQGIAAMTAEMMIEGGVQEWRGHAPLNREALERKLYPYAADVDLSVGKQQTSFRFSAAAADAKQVLETVLQMLLAPAFEQNDFARLKSQALEVLTRQLPLEDMEELGKAALDQQMYGPKHPYSHVTTGTVSTLKPLTLENVRAFYLKNFTRKRLTIGIGGAVSDGILRTVQNEIVQLPGGEESSSSIDVPEAPARSSPQLLIVKGPFDSVGAHFGHPLPFDRASADFPGMYLGVLAFGKHRSFVGRLMNVVRELRGLNYGTYAYVEDFPNGGELLSAPTQAARTRQAFTVWARPTIPENGCFMTKLVYRQIEELSVKGLTAPEFALAKSHLIGNAPVQATGVEDQIGYDIDSLFYGIKGDYLSDLQNSAKKATRGKINALLKKYVHPRELSIVVVSRDPAKFVEELFSGNCPVHYAEGVLKTAQIKSEDAVVTKYTIPLKREDIKTVDSFDVFAR